MAFSSDVISVEKNNHIGTVWLNRPDKYNALSEQVWLDIPAALDELVKSDCRVIILAGKGKHFCVGIDLVQGGLSNHMPSSIDSPATANIKQLEGTKKFQDSVSALANCAVPIIAVVHGHCLGAGIDMITACDIRVGAEGSNYSVRETRIGLVADVGTLQRLPKVISAGHVAELAYSGKDIDAKRAEKIGLINDVYPNFDEAMEGAYKLAETIASNPPLAVTGTKFMLQQSENLTTEQSLMMNGMFTLMTSLKSNDLKESMSAFIEKRPPKYTGT